MEDVWGPPRETRSFSLDDVLDEKKFDLTSLNGKKYNINKKIEALCFAYYCIGPIASEIFSTGTVSTLNTILTVKDFYHKKAFYEAYISFFIFLSQGN